MSFGYFTMWGMLALMVFGAIGGAVYRGDLIGGYRAAYPADAAHQDALRHCALTNPSFSKFSEADRKVCYRTQLGTPAT